MTGTRTALAAAHDGTRLLGGTGEENPAGLPVPLARQVSALREDVVTAHAMTHAPGEPGVGDAGLWELLAPALPPAKTNQSFRTYAPFLLAPCPDPLRPLSLCARHEHGMSLDMAEPGALRFLMRQGQRVRVVFANTTAMYHPMHVHGHTFALSGTGTRKDTVIVLPKQEVACDFDADNPGQWMTHCHNLYHAPESGMMAVLGYQA